MLMEDFEAQLADVYNECRLPDEAKRYVVAHFATEVEKSYHQSILNYRQQAKQKAEEAAIEKQSI